MINDKFYNFQIIINQINFYPQWPKELRKSVSSENTELDTVEQSEKSLKSLSSNNTPDTSVPHAERYIIYDHSDCHQESLMRYLEMQGLQDHLRRWSLRIRHQRRHHCQNHHEQIEKIKRISSSSKIIIASQDPKAKKNQTTKGMSFDFSLFKHVSLIHFFLSILKPIIFSFIISLD